MVLALEYILQSKKHIVEYCDGQRNQHSEYNPAKCYQNLGEKRKERKE